VVRRVIDRERLCGPAGVGLELVQNPCDTLFVMTVLSIRTNFICRMWSLQQSDSIMSMDVVIIGDIELEGHDNCETSVQEAQVSMIHQEEPPLTTFKSIGGPATQRV
jgi:hypothetical protein